MYLFILLIFLLFGAFQYQMYKHNKSHNILFIQQICGSDNVYAVTTKNRVERKESVDDSVRLAEVARAKAKLREDYREWVNNCNLVVEAMNRKSLSRIDSVSD